jgi:diadenosine tetraphosphate (Ap4A) HIT family hydrolase
MGDLPEPFDEAVFYEDERLYSCLANFPKAHGHSVVVWKKEVDDLHLLSREDYEYLMDRVDDVRDAMREVLGVEKVYLVYMDETEHVHWHLIPRYDEKGYDVLEHEPDRVKDFELAEEIEKQL